MENTSNQMPPTQSQDNDADAQAGMQQLIEFIEQSVRQMLGGFGAQIENALSKHNLRLSVLEFLLTSEEGSSYREMLTAGTLTHESLKEIATKHVIPMIKKQYEEAVAEAERQAKQSQSNILDPTGQPASSSGTLFTADGRQLILNKD